MTRTYQIRNTDDIFSIANKTVALDNIYSLLQENDIDIDVDIESISTQYLTYKDIFKSSIASTKILTTPSSIINFKGLEGQSIYDVCLQKLGSLDNIVSFLIDNSIESIDDDNVSLKSLYFDYKNVKDYSIYKKLIIKNINYSTIFIRRTKLSNSLFT